MIKVEHTKTERLVKNLIGGNEVDVLVTDAELVLPDVSKSNMCKIIFADGEDNHMMVAPNNDAFIFFRDKEQIIQPVKPILISQTEKIEVGDWYLTPSGNIVQALGKVSFDGRWKKILALPEHFSPQQLQDIVDGTLKEGKCLVECETMKGFPEGYHEYDYNRIKLNPHITIYPVEKTKCQIKFCQMDDFGGCSCKEEKMYTREEMIINAFKFYSEMSVKMGVPFRLISENRDNAVLWFEQNVK